MNDIDDRPRTQVENYRVALAVLLFATTMAYLVWRLGVLNPSAKVFSWAFLGLESFCLAWGLAFVVMTVRLSHRRSSPSPLGLSVDVFVPTYDEPTSLVRCTLVAAMAIRYPHETWLLDDGDRLSMRELANELGCRYLARQANTDAKAGNLNNALSCAKGDFILVLDADHVALPEFLDETLGYFCDPQVAFVQTPQLFYNFNSFEHLGRNRERQDWSEHTLFHRVIQRERDCANAAMFSGSGAVLRRLALEQIGGFATGSVTEDMHTSVRLHARGWRSVFHARTLSGGLASSDARSYRRQRLRWAQGAMQVCVQEKLWKMPGLSRAQRVAYLSHVVGNFVGWKTLALAFLPSLVLLTNVSPIAVPIGDYLAVFVPCLLINLLVFEELARGHGRFFFTEVHNLARCSSSTLAVFSAWSRGLRFQVTPKVAQLDRSAHAVVLPWIVAVVAAASLCVGAWRAAYGYALWREVGVISLWVLYALFNAVAVIRLARRCQRSAGIEPLFPANLQACMQPCHGGAETLVKITGLAIDRCTLSIIGQRPEADEQLCLDFGIDGTRIALNCSVTTVIGDAVVVRWNFASHSEQAAVGVAVVSHHLRGLSRVDGIDSESMLPRWMRRKYFYRRTSKPIENLQ